MRSIVLAAILLLALVPRALGKGPLEQGEWVLISEDHNNLKVLQVIDQKRMLVYVRDFFAGGKEEQLVMIEADTTGFTDGKWGFWTGERLLVQGTYQYASTTGATRTVPVLKRLTPEEMAAVAAKAKAAAEAYLTREWTDDTGKHKFVGKFLGFKNSRVQLERPESGKQIEVPMLELSKDDQKWVRAELKARADKANGAKKPMKKRK